MVILGECKCMRQAPKQAIEWAIDYHLASLRKEFREWEAIAREPRSGQLSDDPMIIEKNITHLRKELDSYMDLRKEIIELPRCDEPAFEVQSGNPHNPRKLSVPEQHQLKIAKDTLKMSDVGARIMGAKDNPGQGKTVAEILSRRTAWRESQQVEMRAKDKLSMDNFDMTYEQLPDIRKSLVDLAYLRDVKAESNG